MLTRLSILCLSVLFMPLVNAQKVLDHSDFDRWKTITATQVSRDGRWVVYQIKPGEGDPVVVVRNTETGLDRTLERGAAPQLNTGGTHLVYRIQPALDSTRAMRRRKVDADKLPKDTLAIVTLASGAIEKIARIQDFKIPEEWDNWLAYQANPDTSSKAKPRKKDQPLPLTLRHLPTGTSVVLEEVQAFEFSKKQPGLIAASAGKDSTIAPGIYRFDFTQQQFRPLFRRKGQYKQLAVAENGGQFAFLADLDTTKNQIRTFNLYYGNITADTAQLLTASNVKQLPKDWQISANGPVRFSSNGGRLYFGTAPAPMLPDTSILEDEVANLEVWSYTDPRMYTQQKVLLDREKKRSYQAMLNLSTKQALSLGNDTIPDVQIGDEGNSRYALGSNDAPYLVQTSWEGGPACRDLYIIDIQTGSKTLFAKSVCGSPAISPGGKYAYWFNSPQSKWEVLSLEDRKLYHPSGNLKVAFYDELNDVPDYPNAYGIGGWLPNDQALLAYDRYDIWKLDPKGMSAPVNLTNGRPQQITYRYINLDREERFVPVDQPILLHLFDDKDKGSGYARLDLKNNSLKTIEKGPYLVEERVVKAKNAATYVFSRENFQLFPDLLLAKSGDFTSAQRISDANPQQKEYAWGSIELVEWTSLDGQKLQGLLAKPAGFDPSRQYPMIVNFYERSSEGLHRYRGPEANRSQINYSFYTSRGYLVFNPDIPYRIGYPGESAYNAVVSGTTALIDKGFVDRSRIGIQGHSWGGYQIAHILTKTNMFRCAESGAPVVNMISAYGGIRWETGLVRQFQYEKTQSRIGGPIWEYPLRYLEISPVFSLDKIETPVLILANDADGAVPWYQGIEFFTGMRRLGKPAWMLNYNGEPHWPLKYANRKDFQRRMQQFFDHFLKDAPMPSWMQRGVPAIEKGIDWGWELDEGK